MEMVESPVDTIVNAIKFGASNLKTIVLWGAFCFVAVFIDIVFSVGASVVFKEHLWIYVGLRLVGYVPVLIFSILYAGFGCQCIRALLNGESVAPTGLENPGQLIVDGIMLLIVKIEMGIIGLILLLPGLIIVLLSIHRRTQDRTLMIAGVALLLLALIPYAILIVLTYLQYIVYADTRSLLQGLNLLKSAGMVISHPVDSIVTFGEWLIMLVVCLIVLTVCVIFCVSILLIPFLSILFGLAVFYLFVRLYQKCQKLAPTTNGESSG